jgi:hypothetical protein
VNVAAQLITWSLTLIVSVVALAVCVWSLAIRVKMRRIRFTRTTMLVVACILFEFLIAVSTIYRMADPWTRYLGGDASLTILVCIQFLIFNSCVYGWASVIIDLV